MFAAAREAAGAEVLEVAAGPLRLPDLGPRFDRVVAMSTLLCDGLRIAPGDAVADGAVVDVLPPFAGG